MKKLHSKRKVYPPPTPQLIIADHLSLIPATILSLVAALSYEDEETLAYLISCCNSSFSSATTTSGHRKATKNRRHHVDGHDPKFECSCFMCYINFWARWDASPNRQLIHEIIEAYEERLFRNKKQVRKNRRGRRKADGFHDSERGNGHGSCVLGSVDLMKSNRHSEEDPKEIEFESEKGSIRKLASIIGDSVWGVWNRY